jgi:monofunctional biosynthetic peptidoglycan transglycosylase
VLVAEDDAFFAHGGLDWTEIRASARRNLEAGRVVRGGSTITQQLAKNLWLGSARTPWRKLEEVLLALRIERALSKQRIFELYLNVIEWGDGVYGAEAAARRWFGVSADSLTVPQAVRLAAVIINPRRYSPTEPSRRIDGRIRRIASRLLRRGAISDAEYRETVGLPPAESTGIEVSPTPHDIGAPSPLEGDSATTPGAGVDTTPAISDSVSG